MRLPVDFSRIDPDVVKRFELQRKIVPIDTPKPDAPDGGSTGKAPLDNSSHGAGDSIQHQRTHDVIHELAKQLHDARPPGVVVANWISNPEGIEAKQVAKQLAGVELQVKHMASMYASDPQLRQLFDQLLRALAQFNEKLNEKRRRQAERTEGGTKRPRSSLSAASN